MRFRVLGPVEAIDSGQDLTPTAPKATCILATLLVRANELVLTETLMSEIWGDSAPVSAGTTLQTYIYQLRCALGRSAIVTRVGGYVMPVKDDHLDLLKFRAQVRDGRRLLDQHRPEQAAAELRSALDLWRGRPLCNVRVGLGLQPYVVHLEEERRQAAELWVMASFAAGRHREVIGEIRMLVAADPYNEWLHARLIEALSRGGRRREALQAYESLRKFLSENLGIDPMQELRDLAQHVLTGQSVAS